MNDKDWQMEFSSGELNVSQYYYRYIGRKEISPILSSLQNFLALKYLINRICRFSISFDIHKDI